MLHRGQERNPVVFAMSTCYMVVALAVILALMYVVFRLLTRYGGLRAALPGTADCVTFGRA